MELANALTVISIVLEEYAPFVLLKALALSARMSLLEIAEVDRIGQELDARYLEHLLTLLDVFQTTHTTSKSEDAFPLQVHLPQLVLQVNIGQVFLVWLSQMPLTLFIAKEDTHGLARLAKCPVQDQLVLLAQVANIGMEFNVKPNSDHL